MKQDPEMTPREKDVRMMQSPLEWPLMVLPLKKADFTVGFMPGTGCKVYVGNLYDQRFMQMIRDGNVEPVEYESFGAIYDDGWRVD